MITGIQDILPKFKKKSACWHEFFYIAILFISNIKYEKKTPISCSYI